ncbi:MAG TPA: SGNH/GDSL hydrolase family protein [Acidobacteriaceae bacterium]|nr:SGNH/GDSL hydrolase family protein [Acidobacteriaceae bacterium]
MKLAHSLFLVACLLAPAKLLSAQSFYLHDGDRVTFYGDSITAQRYYTRDIQDFVATRYPGLKVEFHNAGVPGDKVTGGYAGDAATRVSRDVKPWDPTVITAMLGMNDGGYVPPDQKIFAEYQTGYEKLLQMLRDAAPAARITLLENTPYDEITHGTEFKGFMATTEQNAHSTPALAAREHLPVVDTDAPVKQLLERAKAADPSYASLLVTDRIHPAEPTHWVMAAAVMRAWHVDPVVSSVAIASDSRTVTDSRRTTVTRLTGDNTQLEWNQMDEALPLPFNFDNELMNFVLSVSDLFSSDQEMLRVTGLRGGEYMLRIDSMQIGSFSADELANGVNLATMKTPMWQQAREYDGELGQRSELESADLILTSGTSVPDRAEGSKVLREAEAEFEQKAKGDLRPATHHYVLTKTDAKPAGAVTR